MTSLIANNIRLSRMGVPKLSPCSIRIMPGELTALVGPNGAGKTSLIRVLTGQYAPDAGTVNLGGHNIASLSSAQRARQLTYLPQLRPLAWPSRVYDVVALGRFAYGGAIGRLSSVDKAAIEKALSDCELSTLAERRADTLSGGELARMHCARAFAAQAPILIADEPIAALDPRHQLKVLGFIRDYVDAGNGALIVLHDLNLSLQFADKAILMDAGKVITSGDVKFVLTSKHISSAFDVTADINSGQIRYHLD